MLCNISIERLNEPSKGISRGVFENFNPLNGTNLIETDID